MATINYSGSQEITGCTITTWTTSTYYSFKLTQDCKISISGTPAINARSGDEFVIQVNEPYIFDRDTKVLLSYPETDLVIPSTYSTTSTSTHTVITTGYWAPILAINTVQELTSYTLVANALVVNAATSAKTEKIRIVYDTTVLASLDEPMSASSFELLSINDALTTTIPANSTVVLEYYYGTANNNINGSKIPTILELTET